MRMVASSTRKGHGELPLSLTHTWGGFVGGIATGATVGLVAAVIPAILDLQRGEPIEWSLVALFGVLGSVIGSIGGGLVGAMNPLPKISELERQGNVFLAVESRDPHDIEWAAQLFEKWGAKPQFRESPPGMSRDWPKGDAPSATA